MSRCNYKYTDVIKEAEVSGVLTAFCDSGILKVASAEYFDDLTEKVACILDDYYTVDDVYAATEYIIKEATGDPLIDKLLNKVELLSKCQKNGDDPERIESLQKEIKSLSRRCSRNIRLRVDNSISSSSSDNTKNTPSVNNTKTTSSNISTAKNTPSVNKTKTTSSNISTAKNTPSVDGTKTTTNGVNSNNKWYQNFGKSWKSWALPDNFAKGNRLKAIGKAGLAWGAPIATVGAGIYGVHKALSN